MLESFDHKLKNKRIWEILYKIQIKLNIKPQMMAELLQLSTKEYYKLKHQCLSIPDSNLRGFLYFFDLSESCFLEESINYKSLSKRVFKRPNSLPEIYTRGANSRARTVLNIIQFIEKNYGWERKHQVLQSFNVNEEHLENPDTMVSMRLSVDVGQWISKKSNTENILYNIGKNAYDLNKSSVVGQELSSSKNLKDLMEQLFFDKMKKYFETNLNWKIQQYKDCVYTIQSHPNPDAEEKIGKTIVNSEVAYKIREGFFTSLPRYLGLADAQIKRVKCVNQGDQYSEFTLDCRPALLKLQTRQL